MLPPTTRAFVHHLINHCKLDFNLKTLDEVWENSKKARTKGKERTSDFFEQEGKVDLVWHQLQAFVSSYLFDLFAMDDPHPAVKNVYFAALDVLQALESVRLQLADHCFHLDLRHVRKLARYAH